MNQYAQDVFKARGGRIGSGTGALLEALWMYKINEVLCSECSSYEIAWFPNNQYHDFACILKNFHWNEHTREGELFRIEVKSMNKGADESKAHFDVLSHELNDYDALLVLVWEWLPVGEFYFCPQVVDVFFDVSVPLTELHDGLHLARGGSFVLPTCCPDGCAPTACTHGGEPLNASGKRERLSGPESTRPSARVSYAANFGGLVRMLKTDNISARQTFRALRKQSCIADSYISFIHKNFPSEEYNQYTIEEFRSIALQLGFEINGLSKQCLHQQIRAVPNYMGYLRML
jgi:hypothetical protein